LAEYIRQFLKHAFEEAIRFELQEMLGRKPYERAESTANYRNGSYNRNLETRFGVIENIKVARDRNGEFYPGVLDRYQRREKKIDQRVIELFIGGISTRKMKKITRDLYGKGYSASTISKINKQLTEEMRTWMEAPIEAAWCTSCGTLQLNSPARFKKTAWIMSKGFSTLTPMMKR